MTSIAVGAASQRWWLSFKDGGGLEKDGKIPIQRKKGIFKNSASNIFFL